MSKKSYIQKGRNYLLWAAICLAISYGLYLVDIAGVIAMIVNLAMVVLFIGGLGYIITGLVKRG